MELTNYHAKLFAYELTRKHPAGEVGKLTAALQDAKVDLNPHQIDAALFAFKSPLSKGALLADEVGLGKTIEAGLILSQQKAEGKNRLLIITPANLRKQWNQELVDKFYLSSIILEQKSFNEEIKKKNLNPFDNELIVICSYQFARSKEIYIKMIDWDLVIIDEAHRLRNVYKTGNKIARSIKTSLAERKKVLLTATPLQNSLLELYGLVSIIDDYAFGSIKSFKTNYTKDSGDDFTELKSRLAPLCQRTLRRQVLEYINYTNRRAILEEFSPYREEQELYDLVSEYLRSDTLYALPAGQRTLMTLVLRKLLASSTFAISHTLEGLVAKLNNLENQPLQPAPEEIADDLDDIDDYIDEWEESAAERETLDDEEDQLSETKVSYFSEAQREEIRKERERLVQFVTLAKSINKNSKGEKLITALNKGFEQLRALGALQKAIIFTESKRTQQYLVQILKEHRPDDVLVLFNGNNNDAGSIAIYNAWVNKHKGTDIVTGSKTADMRQALVEYFRDSATIMIATEAAAEGINLQFCSFVVNYDMPWNPQRIEQRIGRCHRYGQKHDVVVLNFLNIENEADRRVYQLLDEKFRLFSGVFGASDEVLGTIGSGVDFEKRIANIYKSCRTPDEIKHAFDALQNELEPEIETQLDVTKKKLLENFDEDVTKKLRINLEAGKEYLNRYEQWLWAITKFYLRDNAHFDHSENSFTLLNNPFPGEKIHAGPYLLLRAGTAQKKSETELATDTNIYRIGHPLAQKIIRSCKSNPVSVKRIVLDYANTPKKISILEPYMGKSGWVKVALLTVSSFDTEEFIIFSGVTDDGEVIAPEICNKLFSLSGSEGDSVSVPEHITVKLKQGIEQEKISVLDEAEKRNARYLDNEYEKLDKWAEDMKLSLEKEIKDLDAEIKLRKAEVRKITDLTSKIEEHREIKELEKKRNDKRKTLYESQDEVDDKKGNLLDEIGARAKKSVGLDTLFTIQWLLV